MDHTKKLLKDKGLEDFLIENVIQIFQTSQGAGLRVISTKRSEVSERVCEKLQKALTPEEIIKAEEMHKADNTVTRERLNEIRIAKEKLAGSSKEEDKITLKNLLEEQRALQQKNMKSGSEFRAMKLSAEKQAKIK